MSSKVKDSRLMIFIYAIAFFKILALPLVATWLYNRVFCEAGYSRLACLIAWVPCFIPLTWLVVSIFILPTETMLPVSVYANQSGALNALVFLFLFIPLAFLAFSSWPIFEDDED